MPTLVIPCSDPWPSAVVDGHFVTLSTPYTLSLAETYTDILSGALTDPAGGSGYLYMDEAGYEAAEYAAGGTGLGYGLACGGAARPTPLNIAADKVTAIRAVAVARAVSGVHPLQVFGDREARGAYANAGNWAPGTTYGAMPPTWTTYTSSASSNVWTVPTLWTDFAGRAAAGALSVQLSPSRVSGEPMGVVHVAWLAIEIDYMAGRGPRLRKYPISPLRQWPAERYYGRSNRRAGGYL